MDVLDFLHVDSLSSAFEFLSIGFFVCKGIFTFFFKKKVSPHLKKPIKIYYSRFFFYVLVCFMLLMIFFVFCSGFHLPPLLIQTSLLILVTLMVNTWLKNPIVKVCVPLLMWSFFLLYITGLVRPVFLCLNDIPTYLTSNSFNVAKVVKSVLIISVIVCGAYVFSNYLKKHIQKKKHTGLFAKLTLSRLMSISFVVFLSLIGIVLFEVDFSTFSFLLGIIAIGITFSMHNILTDLFSGFFLLMDRSIKPGNIISMNDGQLYGVVNKLCARYVSLTTQEGKEHLIPNKHIISNKLENWSCTENRIRVEISFRVSIQTDPLLVENLLKKIALSTNRVIDQPSPTVCFHALTDSYVDLFLCFWISDLQHGMSDIRSEIILKAWKAFRDNEIKMPISSQETYGNLVDIKENRTINFP